MSAEPDACCRRLKWQSGWPTNTTRDELLGEEGRRFLRTYGDPMKNWISSLQSLNSFVLATAFIGVSVDSGGAGTFHVQIFFGALSFVFSALAMVLLTSALRVLGAVGLFFDLLDENKKQARQEQQHKELTELLKRLAGVEQTIPLHMQQTLPQTTAEDRQQAERRGREYIAQQNFKRKVFWVLYFSAEILTIIGLMCLFVATIAIVLVKIGNANTNALSQIFVIVTCFIAVLSAFAVLIPHFVALDNNPQN